MPSVFNKRTDRIPDGAVYVGRPTKWGNPSRVGIDGTRKECVEDYRSHVASSRQFQADIRRELVGRDLVCWCSPLPCHADILLEIANS